MFFPPHIGWSWFITTYVGFCWRQTWHCGITPSVWCWSKSPKSSKGVWILINFRNHNYPFIHVWGQDHRTPLKYYMHICMYIKDESSAMISSSVHAALWEWESVGIRLMPLGNAAYVACLLLLCQGSKWLNGMSIWLVFRRSWVRIPAGFFFHGFISCSFSKTSAFMSDHNFIHLQNTGSTPLMLAIEYDRLQVAKKLLSCNVKLHATNKVKNFIQENSSKYGKVNLH